MRLGEGAALACAGALAFWPVARWYVARVAQGGDETAGLLALATLGYLLWRQRAVLPAPRGWQLAVACLLLVGYGVTFGAAYPLVRALFAVGVAGVLLARAPAALALGLLLFLALPLGASLQFFAGYPLRLLVAEASATLLQLGGLEVARQGVMLHWAGETILVDAPCSGLKMLWAGGYFAAALAAWHRLGSARSLCLFALAGGILLVANIVRSTLLFFKEAQVVALPAWTHAGIGLLVFAGAALALLYAATRLREGKGRHAC